MIKSLRTKGPRAGLIFLDGLWIYASWTAVLRLTPGGAAPPREEVLLLISWTGLVTLLTFYLFNLYDATGRQKPAHLVWNLFLSHAAAAAGVVVLQELLQTEEGLYPLILVASSLQLLLSSGFRALWFFIGWRRSRHKKTVLLTGIREEDLECARKLVQGGRPWLEIHSVLRTGGEGDTGRPGILRRLEVLLLDGTRVLLVGPGVPPALRQEAVRLAGARNVEVLMVPELLELSVRGAELQQLDDQLLYSLRPPGLTRTERFIKRGADLGLAALLLIAASPLMLLLLVAVPLTSKGGALYVQERLGLRGRPFPLLKFRSMVDRAEAGTGPVLAGDGDERITRLGRWMRATRLDELPQLVNVLLGHMSLVGPRPEREHFVSRFSAELPHYDGRMAVKPGLTGYAQVMACYATTAADKLRYDLAYIHNYSLLLDLKILVQTIRVVLQREQAKGVSGAGASPASSASPAYAPTGASAGLSAEVPGASAFMDSRGTVRLPPDNVYPFPHR
ncbi:MULTISPECIES: sugar transferase [Paenibacillus]|uniref:sugar transferase n=1 Tax=Paenibacillus TaxID=44249 RepID=UPI002FE0BDA5